MEKKKQMSNSLFIMGLLLLVIVISDCQLTQASLTPVGIGGRVKVDGVYTNNLTVTIKNMNTGNTAVTTTTQVPIGAGFYQCALNADNNDVLNITCVYNGTAYHNQSIVDLNKVTQWLNLSIVVMPGTYTPIANFTWTPSNIYIGTMVSFHDTSTDVDADMVSWVWSIGGTVYTTRNPNHIFPTSGLKIVTLTVTDQMSHIDICSKNLNVISGDGGGGDDGDGGGGDDDNPPSANFNYNPSIVFVGNQVEFNDTSTDVDHDISVYNWTVNNLPSGETRNITKYFNATGTQAVKLTVTDSKGNTDSKTRVFYVHNLNDSNVTLFNVTVKVKINSQGLPLVNVSLYNQSVYLQSVLTNNTGVGILHVNQGGNYRITVSFQSVSESKNVTVSGDVVVLFNIGLQQNDSTNPTSKNPFKGNTVPGFEALVFIAGVALVMFVFKRRNKKR